MALANIVGKSLITGQGNLCRYGGKREVQIPRQGRLVTFDGYAKANYSLAIVIVLYERDPGKCLRIFESCLW